MASGTVQRPDFTPGATASKLVSASTSSDPLTVVAALAEDERARGVFRVARSISEPATLSAVFVIEVPSTVTDWMLTAVDIEDALRDPVVRAREEHRLRAELEMDNGVGATPLDLAVGSAGECILEHARGHGADLIVVGLRHHTPPGRWLGNDTVGRLLAAQTFPVLAVVPPLSDRPRHVVVGIDFTAASLRAAALARRIVAPDGMIRLVHVREHDADARLERDRAEQALGRRGATAMLDALTRELHPTPELSISSVIVGGDPAEMLALFCTRDGVDLLAIGSQRRRLRDRIRIGSVADSLRHHAPCSMLLAPPPSDGGGVPTGESGLTSGGPNAPSST